MVPSLPLLSHESSVSVKENPDRKKKLVLSIIERPRNTRFVILVSHAYEIYISLTHD